MRLLHHPQTLLFFIYPPLNLIISQFKIHKFPIHLISLLEMISLRHNIPRILLSRFVVTPQIQEKRLFARELIIMLHLPIEFERFRPDIIIQNLSLRQIFEMFPFLPLGPNKIHLIEIFYS